MRRGALFAFILFSTAWAEDGDVTLVNGKDQYSGTVQIEFGGKSGTVCNDKWNIYAADVVCRELFGNVSTSMATAHFATKSLSNNVFLDEVDCRGDENRLKDCVHGPLGQSSCRVENSAGVICWNTRDFQADVAGGRVFRLAGGPTSSEGRVEVFTDGSWGSVCGEGWSSAGAIVACRQLGCENSDSVASYSSDSIYGPGVLDIVWTKVECSGAEATLIDCPMIAEINTTTCSHEKEAGASCKCGITVTIGEGNTGNGVVNLIDMSKSEGSLCYNTVSLREADVACREAGFPGALSTAPSDASSGNILDTSYICIGYEISLASCTMKFNATSECTDGKEAVVVCQSEGELGTPAGSTAAGDEAGGLGTGAIVGIVIGVLIAVVTIVVIAFFLLRGRQGAPARY